MLDDSGFENMASSSTSETTDCSGEGTTWGPGIAQPPDGCGRRLQDSTDPISTASGIALTGA